MNEISSSAVLHEPSLADAMRMIGSDETLLLSTRTHWLCSIRRVSKWIGRPPEFLAARMTSLRHPVGRLNAARLGVSPKTLANHKSNVRAALCHLAKRGLTPSRGAPLSPPWDSLFGKVTDSWARNRLYALFRYASGRGLMPDDTDDRVLKDFFAHREQTTFLDVTPGRRRELARAWNACVDAVPGFPSKRVSVEPLTPHSSGPEWNAFPQSFRDEIEAYLTTLGRPHRSASGRRRPGCNPSTIATRRRELMAAARMAVACGIPIDTFTGLRDLVVPETSGKVLDAYWSHNGERPNNYVIDLAWKLLSVARETGCLSEDQLSQLDDMRYSLELHRRSGLTEKNLAVVRAVLSTDIWTRIIRLPDRLMEHAYKYRSTSPVKAAVLAELATAIRILTYAPVRIGNLASISLDTNLIRPGGLDGPYWLTFPDYDVKNEVDLSFPFDEHVSEFIHRFVRDFRPMLLRGSNQPWLFPGSESNGRHKLPRTLSDQITRCIVKELGLRITAHQFRHAAAAIILMKQPGNYELVRRILGHRNIQTTIAFYIGLETMASSQQFGKMIQLAGRGGQVS